MHADSECPGAPAGWISRSGSNLGAGAPEYPCEPWDSTYNPSAVNQTRTMASMPTQEQLSQYRDDGFLLVTDPLLPEDEITLRRGTSRSALRPLGHPASPTDPRPSGEATPPIARVHWLKALDPVLAHCELLETCRGLAAAILGSNQVWCRFDAAVYKHPGAGSVEWHEDFALTAFRHTEALRAFLDPSQ